MDRTLHLRFATYEEAMAYLEERGKLVYFGRVGNRAETYVFNIHLPDGRVNGLFINEDGYDGDNKRRVFLVVIDTNSFG
ncbi:hypothetical protein PAECIP111802_04922 [Paenibacillus allorhizosphaerae]|uniref:Uncharacterized protein n=1 Tax=Paenibacillus allorhizosphaerae TaxID=2849866 RepID=A0ABN7TUY0_9BACL|nr:hypothetical protein PAECIP111802_04922 [Paenibacillus allorhizosphaerae]